MARPKSALQRAAEFFAEHAGYSKQKGESEAQARRRSGRELAKAEAEAEKRGWTFTWEHDDWEDVQNLELESDYHNQPGDGIAPGSSFRITGLSADPSSPGEDIKQRLLDELGTRRFQVSVSGDEIEISNTEFPVSAWYEDDEYEKFEQTWTEVDHEQAKETIEDFLHEAEVTEVLSCLLKDEEGNVLGSLGGVQFGNNSSESKSYGRVVEAELALEALSELEGK